MKINEYEQGLLMGQQADSLKRSAWLKVIARAFKDYQSAGKVLEDFEEDYGCTVIYEETGTGLIADISFDTEANMVAFKLKYDI